MDKELLPVGSIVRFNEYKAMITGYFFDREQGNPELKYLLMPYPVGLVTDDALTKCEIDKVSLISEGYKTEMSESFADYLMFMNEYLKEHSEEELFTILNSQDEEVSL